MTEYIFLLNILYWQIMYLFVLELLMLLQPTMATFQPPWLKTLQCTCGASAEVPTPIVTQTVVIGTISILLDITANFSRTIIAFCFDRDLF